MTYHQLTVSKWIDRCALRVGALLPGMEPMKAADVAVALQRNAYEMLPEDAGAIYALELAPSEAGYVSDFESTDPYTWVLAYTMEGASAAQLSAAVRAGRAVLDAASVHPFDAFSTHFLLERWDVNSFAAEFALTPEQTRAYDVPRFEPRKRPSP